MVVGDADYNLHLGWHSTPGQFIRTDATGKARLEGERTISSLLASIQASLHENSFNRFFAYLDETKVLAKQSEYDGFSIWLDNQDDVKALHNYLPAG
jgi:hypothetical protein